jgi:ketosteroid isomerase-like protein
MSQESAELVHRRFDAFSQRDIDAALRLIDPDVEIVPLTGGLAGGTRWHGHDGVRAYVEELLELSPDLRAEVTAVTDYGDATLFAYRTQRHGAGSGAPFEQMLWAVGEIADGKLLGWRIYASEAEALEAVGLSE